MFMKVDFPEPEGPMMATNSPGRDAQIDVLQRRERPGRRVVGLAQALDADDRLIASPLPSEHSHADTVLLVGRRIFVGRFSPDHHLVAGLEVAADDLGIAVVGDARA